MNTTPGSSLIPFVDEDSAPSVCDNCGRIVQPAPRRVAVFVDGHTTAERRLCSACLVHVKEQFQLPAPWVGAAPAKVR